MIPFPPFVWGRIWCHHALNSCGDIMSQAGHIDTKWNWIRDKNMDTDFLHRKQYYTDLLPCSVNDYYIVSTVLSVILIFKSWKGNHNQKEQDMLFWTLIMPACLGNTSNHTRLNGIRQLWNNIFPEWHTSVTYTEINTLARELAFLVMWLTRPTSFRS